MLFNSFQGLDSPLLRSCVCLSFVFLLHSLPPAQAFDGWGVVPLLFSFNATGSPLPVSKNIEKSFQGQDPHLVFYLETRY